VALSADAKTLVVGAPGLYDNTDKEGYVKVYRMTDDGGSRTQLGQTIYGNATGDLFGWSVDVTAQGNVIVLSSTGYSVVNDRPGYVQVFSLDSDDETAGTTGTWKQVGQDIAGEAIGDEFGASVSISDDGKTIAVGAYTNDGKNGVDSGHVRIYRLSDDGTSWEQIGEDIDGDAAGDGSGISVSLSANGTIVAIGAPRAGIDGIWTGQVKVYRIDSGGSKWEQLGESIYGDNENDWFGRSVDISPDGNSLAVGTYVDVGPGYVKVFSLENGGGDDDDLGASSWKQIGLTITGEANGDWFGYSVSLSDDAKTLAVGASDANGEDGDDVGHVRVYRRDDSESGWTKIGVDIDGEAAYDYSGLSVSLSGDGKTVAIGSDGNDDNGVNSGHVRVFVAEWG
jgi:6-phosphogluconolactonase (cycloisomerase 2 family)